MFYHVFCIDWKERINTFFKKKKKKEQHIFVVQPLRYLYQVLILTLFNLLLHNLPFLLKDM